MEIPQKLSLQTLGLFTYIDNCTENSVPNIFAKYFVQIFLQNVMFLQEFSVKRLTKLVEMSTVAGI